MLKSIKCSDCQNTFEVDIVSKSPHFIFKKGKYFDKDTGKEILPDRLPDCPKCGSSSTFKLISGCPQASFPIHDLTYSISKKRMLEGLYSDVSSKSKKKIEQNSAELNYNAHNAEAQR